MAQGLIFNGTNTRARRILSDIWPFNAVGSFALSIKLRGMRVTHPTRQRLMVAPSIALSIENGELKFTTTLPAGGNLALLLGGATDGDVQLARYVDYNRGVSTFRLRLTTRGAADRGATGRTR